MIARLCPVIRRPDACNAVTISSVAWSKIAVEPPVVIYNDSRLEVNVF
jgi:hypothetical protein